MYSLAKELIQTGLDAADAEKLTSQYVKETYIETPSEKQFFFEDYERVVLLGAGKAAPFMAQPFKKCPIDDGLIIADSRSKIVEKEIPVKVIRGSHPYPTEENIHATHTLIRKLEKNDGDTLFIFLISGGGSSLLCSPAGKISIDDLNELNRLLVSSGMDIHQINTVRKHVSKVKGGRLVEGLKGDIVTFILSDVVRDDLSMIASGPTVTDDTSFKAVIDILKEFSLWDKVPNSVSDYLSHCLIDKIEDKLDDNGSMNVLIGNNMVALQAMYEYALDTEFKPMILTSRNRGEAKEVAKLLAGIVEEIVDTKNPLSSPAALILGGEMTVSLDNAQGSRGGPNREFVLSAALELLNLDDVVICSVDSDGIDGVGRAGAIISPSSLRNKQPEAKEHLKKHDTETFFDEMDASITFDGTTNVNDISVILIR